LAIASRLVNLMGGQIAVESKLNEGSCFSFALNLPISMKEILSDQKKMIPLNLADGYKVLALVVDDNKDNRDVLSGILKNIGVSVITAENGQQAVDTTLSNNPDIVFMDIWMPVMDGLQALGEIISKCEKNKPKLVAVSASVLEHERKRYLDSGFDSFIAKPVIAEKVYESLASLLHIEYEYDSMQSPGIPKVAISESLLSRLKESAEMGSINNLKECIDKVGKISEEGRLLAERLNELCGKFDMKGVLDILKAMDCD